MTARRWWVGCPEFEIDEIDNPIQEYGFQQNVGGSGFVLKTWDEDEAKEAVGFARQLISEDCNDYPIESITAVAQPMCPKCEELAKFSDFYCPMCGEELLDQEELDV